MNDCKNIPFSCSIPVRYRVDVCVVGAGPAGCAAATCAAEQGANVLLIESTAMSGGMSTAARVPMFMPFATGGKLLCEGYGRRILNGLKKCPRKSDTILSMESMPNICVFFMKISCNPQG